MTDAERGYTGRTLWGLYPCGCLSIAVVENLHHAKSIGDFYAAVARRGLTVVETRGDEPRPPIDCPDPATCQAPDNVQRLRAASKPPAGGRP